MHQQLESLHQDTIEPNKAEGPAAHQKGNSPPNTPRPISNHQDNQRDNDNEPVLGISHRDTEARIEGDGTGLVRATQTPAATGTSEMTGPNPQDVLPLGRVKRVSTWPEAGLSPEPREDGLRRRFVDQRP